MFPISAQVKPYRGKPTIHLNGVPHPPIIYSLPDVPGGRWSWEEIQQHNLRQFYQQGVKLFQLDIFLDHVWLKDGSFDLKLAQKQVRGVLQICPEAGVFFRFHVRPPTWWVAKHPGENVVYGNVEASPDEEIGLTRILEADPRNPVRTSMASTLWKSDCGEKLAEFCRAFSQTPEGNALIGIQVANGVFGEWHQWGIMHHEADFSPPMETHFVDWLKAKYQTNEGLQAAWGNLQLTFNDVKVPTVEERKQLSEGNFRHAVKERPVIDYYQCQHELIVDNIIHFSRIVKENWPREIITGTFYGYFFSVFGRQAAAGHLALHRLLNSKQVDYLSGPQSYYPESGYNAGEPYRSRCLNYSLLLNGKLWLDEYDQQPRRSWPYLAIKDNREVYAQTVAENVSLIKRNVLSPLLRGQGLWFYDFGPSAMHIHPRNDHNDQSGTSGYWDHPAYMKCIGEVIQLAEELLHRPYQSHAEVLAVYDTQSILFMPSTADEACPITNQILNWSTVALYYAGSPFDSIHIHDLKQVDLDRYKAVVFFNTFLMDEDQKHFIKDQVASRGRHLVWMYAPAFHNGKETSASFVSDITGITLKSLEHEKTPEIKINGDFVDAVNQKAQAPLNPLFYLDDDEAEKLGHYEGTNKPGLGMKALNDSTSWYSGVPVTDYQIFRQLLKQAGVSQCSVEKDLVYAGSNLLMFHSSTDGTKSLTVKGTTHTVHIDQAPGTKVVDITTGAVILE